MPDQKSTFLRDLFLRNKRDLFNYLRRRVDALPPRCREASVLHISAKLPPSEIVKRLGISTNMAQEHVRLTFQRCRAATDKNFATNLDLKGKFATGPLEHSPLVGFDYFNTYTPL